jgi:hypothetical protein
VDFAARVENLDGVIGVVASYAEDGLPGLRGDGDAAVAIGDLRVGIEQRFAQLPEGAHAADVGEIGTGKAAAAANGVAVGARRPCRRTGRRRLAASPGTTLSKATAVRLRR